MKAALHETVRDGVRRTAVPAHAVTGLKHCSAPPWCTDTA